MDAKAFGQEIAAMVREHVAKRTEPLERRIAELEADRVAFKGTWQASGKFKRGDLVTHSGALWFVTRNTTGERPGDSAAYQLALKQGAAK